MRKFKTFDEAREKLREHAYNIFESKLNKSGFDLSSFKSLDVPELRQKIEEIETILASEEKLESLFGYSEYMEGHDYTLTANRERGPVGFMLTASPNLFDRKKAIFELIKQKERESRINSLDELVNNIKEKELKAKFRNELKELEEQANRYDEEEKAIDKEADQIKIMREELEISKSKLEIFDKKSQIWLRILDKESIASILGGLILFIMSISLIVAMFTGVSTTNIIESAFLLILGYFFGQAVSKK